MKLYAIAKKLLRYLSPAQQDLLRDYDAVWDFYHEVILRKLANQPIYAQGIFLQLLPVEPHPSEHVLQKVVQVEKITLPYPHRQHLNSIQDWLLSQSAYELLQTYNGQSINEKQAQRWATGETIYIKLNYPLWKATKEFGTRVLYWLIDHYWELPRTNHETRFYVPQWAEEPLTKLFTTNEIGDELFEFLYDAKSYLYEFDELVQTMPQSPTVRLTRKISRILRELGYSPVDTQKLALYLSLK